VATLSSVLHSERAVQVNIEIMRALVRLGRLLGSHDDLARKLVELEKRYRAPFSAVFDALRWLMDTTPPPKRKRSGSVDMHYERV